MILGLSIKILEWTADNRAVGHRIVNKLCLTKNNPDVADYFQQDNEAYCQWHD